MDSTLKSNISVGLPLDLLVYEANTLRVTKFVHIDSSNQYMAMIRATWGACGSNRCSPKFPIRPGSIGTCRECRAADRDRPVSACAAAGVSERRRRASVADVLSGWTRRRKSCSLAACTFCGSIGRTSRRRCSMPRRESDRPPAYIETLRARESCSRHELQRRLLLEQQ